MRLRTIFHTTRTHISLRLAIILAVVFGLTVPAAILIPYHLNSIEIAARARNTEDHHRLVDILSVILSEPLWQITPEIANISSEVVYSDPRVATIAVITLPDRKEFIKNNVRQASQKGPFTSMTRQITHGGQVIGEVTLTLAEDLLQESLRSDFRRYVTTAVLSLFLAILFILMVLQWRLVKPVKLLMDQSDRLANGELNDPIALDREDELGHLATSLEATRQALRRSFGELEIKNQQLLEYSGTLESKVRQRTQELESVNTNLEAALHNVNTAQAELARVERMAALGSMVAGVAHELNTPLGNCLLVASTLEEETRRLLQMVEDGQMRRSDLNRYAATALDSTKLLLRGLQQSAHLVGDFKQVAVDQSSAQRRRFGLLVVLQELSALLHSSLRKTPFTLELDIPAEIELDSYPGLLGQVFTNLVNNSVIHGLEGRSEGHMRCSAKQNADYVMITFTDNGKGIPPEIINRIFEPFFTTKFGQGGSGLGLSITFNIIGNVLGGNIRVISMPGQGTRFEIKLPLIAPGDRDSSDPLRSHR
ncbi:MULTISPECIES: sensor histidine kinase [unclassified Undibacterium]|uniref:sensor histidine kinase n=1 Tax=unclassified Undibacterium TaxID=2630295 RepID=UPI002AC9B86E|nr:MULTISPECIES: ATP-binding protein [unclassified Undibacterium]MEB0138763.1 ATP-binding protein [Undibacterium sp. CCC2.1]MEB0170761.1 ATP-binding protein [Undibacterium sp. CCC1.1]MEB0174650.1 ATP-binding protein [Undibacterium sp. CCC3.4]MEB0213847.1 ATP-binding protein [Undibacterium sp. 5I2]WPX42573.1 ATP-binding protein [Undibacterium sp. CCC3.4]